MKTVRLAFKLHRYLSYLLFAQLLFWILGGAIFAIIPFDDITKSGNVVAKPAVTLPQGWPQQLATVTAANISQISAIQTPAGAAFKLKGKDETLLIQARNGQPPPKAERMAIARFALTIYKGEGQLVEVKRIDETETRLLIVDELYGQTGVWQASFDDAYGTRLYFDGSSGEYLKARNNYWVLFDLFWRLHVMDYSAGENFNNWLLRIASVLALLFSISGLILTWNAARRELSCQPAKAVAQAAKRGV